MMMGDMRLDTTRYTTRFNDRIIESYEDGNIIAHITESGNVLITNKEPYITKASKDECPEKNEIFDMVKFIITKNKGIISSETIETVLRAGDPDLTESLRKELNLDE